jgi:hypothetical protein
MQLIRDACQRGGKVELEVLVVVDPPELLASRRLRRC